MTFIRAEVITRQEYADMIHGMVPPEGEKPLTISEDTLKLMEEEGMIFERHWHREKGREFSVPHLNNDNLLKDKEEQC